MGLITCAFSSFGMEFAVLVIVPHKIVIISSDSSLQNCYYKLVYCQSQSLFVTDIQYKTEKLATLILKYMKKIKYLLSFSLNPDHFESVIIQALFLPMLLHFEKKGYQHKI